MLSFWFLSFFVVAATAIRCPPCHLFKCKEVSSCENGYIKEKAGFCGCCSICVPLLDEGDKCRAPTSVGSVIRAECKPGLHCDEKARVCLSTNEKTCQQIRDEMLSKLDGFIVGINPPQCDSDGFYSARQCIEAVCHCADRAGNRLQDYTGAIGDFSESTCKCAREEEGLKHLGRRVKCNAVGNYEGLQCTGSVCYCVDPKEGKNLGDAVHISQAHKLNC